MAALAAVRELLGALHFEAIEHLEGAKLGEDLEELHDFRVAVRRARALLKDLKKLLPEDLSELRDHLKHLGTITNAARDADVAVEDFVDHRSHLSLETAHALEPYRLLLDRRRRRCQDRVRIDLGAETARIAYEAWECAVTASCSGSSGLAGRELRPIAAKHIAKAFKRLQKRSHELEDEPRPPVETLHAIRLDAKRLRYLIELFGPLWPDGRLIKIRKRLKGLQDHLGALNDCAIQLSAIERDAAQLKSRGVELKTLLGLGQISFNLDRRFGEAREAAPDRLLELAGADVQKVVRSL